MTGAGGKLTLGCRNSRLALAQADEVAAALSVRFPDIEIDTVAITTSGDTRRNLAVSEIGVGVFVKEIEAALLSGEIDVAVHSLKDLPSKIPDGLSVAGVPYREDPRDAVISKHSGGIALLPRGSVVATGSARRRALINAERNDLILKPIRGNVTTRLQMLDDDDSIIDALVLAAAGLKRINMENRISEYLSCMSFVAAPGQGALALQTRSDDSRSKELCAAIEHDATRICVDAERAFIAEIGSGCSAPIGAHARVDDDSITLAVMVSDPSGVNLVRIRDSARVHEGVELGKRLAGRLIENGARNLLPRLVASSPA
ncbi:MAG: hydroxymethylbilane synthase [Chloroflexi bacterium]|nr:hydroxymethylbilane synthase [Chloroflexota bacterium]